MAVLLFDQAALDRAIAQAIPENLPEGHSNALVGTADINGVQVVLGVTKDVATGTLQIDGVWKRDWTGNQSVGAKMIYSW